MNDGDPQLPESLLEQVLQRLGLNARPSLNEAGMRELYAAWCQRVPFDNVRKLIHLHEGSPLPFPGTEPQDYLLAWLKHGTGGTCWAGSAALCAVLQSLGFSAERGIATMIHAPEALPNHGTVKVTIAEQLFLVDTSILFGEPLPLSDGDCAEIAHPAWGVTARQREGHWYVSWRPLHKTDGFECRLERFGSSMNEHRERYDRTLGWSPFNYQLTARRNHDHEVVGMAFGNAVTIRADRSVHAIPIDDAMRRQMLIECFGMSEEIVARLPADRPTPPPPGSKTAAAQTAP